MPWYRMPGDIAAHINFGGRQKRAPAQCAAPHEWAHGKVCLAMGGFQCDWKVGPGLTCDRHLCAEHALEVAPDKHLCPEHQAAYKVWQASRPAAKV